MRILLFLAGIQITLLTLAGLWATPEVRGAVERQLVLSQFAENRNVTIVYKSGSGEWPDWTRGGSYVSGGIDI